MTVRDTLSLGTCGLACVLLLVACAPTVSDKDRANARLHYDIGIASLNRGDERGALRELMLAAELDPELAVVRNALGLVYHSLGKLDEAHEQYRAAVRLKPDFSEAYNNLGILLIDLARYDEAIAAFKVALKDILYATPALAEGNLGWAYYKKGDVELALRHLRNAVAANPGFCRGYEWLARIAIDRDRGDEAVAAAKRFRKYCVEDATVAADVAPQYIHAMEFYLGLGYLKQGEREAARQAFAACGQDSAESEFQARCRENLAALGN